MAIFPILGLVLGLSASPHASQSKPPPKEPAEPFAVYVFTEMPGDPDDGNSIGRTTEEVAKKIRDRKKWFRTVEHREDAEIVVEVLDQSRKGSTEQGLVRRTDNADPTDRQMAVFGDVKDTHLLVARIHVPKGKPVDMEVAADGRRPRDAAKPFAVRLETFVRLNYWTLMAALGK